MAARGTDADVLRFLRDEPIAPGSGVELALCAWRLRDAAFCARVLGLLAARFAYDATLWGYAAALHKDSARLAEMLPRGAGPFSVSARCGVGPAFRSRLLTVDPLFRLDAEHLEYSPLMNARAHEIGAARTVPNLALRRRYAALLARVAHTPAAAVGPDDRAALAYYLPANVSRSTFTHLECGHRPSQALNSADRISAPVY